QLAVVIEESVERFARETGIAATFTNAGSPAALPRRACAGIMRIVQEALANVRKHSGAETVRVRLGSTPTRAVILVEDDGLGFGFDGRMTVDADDPCGPARERIGTMAVRGRHATAAIPLVIRDSVLALGGQLTIESRPERGASLQITIPVDARMAAPDVDRWMAS